jgi:glutathione synthase/RimK-type ligase-like ATP-grasp enzyme
MPKEISEAHVEYCLREADWYIRGLLYSKQAAWMSHPVNVQIAESKIYQLSIARSLGFGIPDTIVTNDPEEVRDFFKRKKGSVIAKPLRLGYFNYGETQTGVYTNQVKWEDLLIDESIRIAPVIYQELIPKLFDIRVTVVGQEVFAVAIDSQSIPSASIDWRRSDTASLGHHLHTLPTTVADICLGLVDKLSLAYGAIDLILTVRAHEVVNTF